jgi:hypothetical protein
VPRIDWVLPALCTSPGAVEGVCSGVVVIGGSTAELLDGFGVVSPPPGVTGKPDVLPLPEEAPLDPPLLDPLLPLDPLDPCDEDDDAFFTVSACVAGFAATSVPVLGSSPVARAVTVTFPLFTLEGIATVMATCRDDDRVVAL